MIYITSTIEIALIILLPLIVFYQRSSWIYKTYWPNIVLLYLIWYFSYALLHELGHMIAALISGAHILNYQLIPPFWKGDLITAFVNSNCDTYYKAFLVGLGPYFRDLLFLVIGYLMLKRKGINNSFLMGLILVLFIFSPLYDIMNNYFPYLFGVKTDFYGLSLSAGKVTANMIGIGFSSIAIVIIIYIFKIYKNFP